MPAPEAARTLVEVLDWHVAQHPERLHSTVLQDESIVLATLTYGELAKARPCGSGGIDRGRCRARRPVALMLPTGAEFFIAFFGILYAGAVPVPIYPPMQLSKIEEYHAPPGRHSPQCRRPHSRHRPRRLCIRFAAPAVSCPQSMRCEASQSLSASGADIQLPILRDGAATALIQYTSGSTGDPKGVVLSHANLLANIRAIGRVIEANSADVFVSWLPLYHDMGLIGAWLGSLYFAASLYVMSPLSFLARPQSWLWAMHRFRATISAAPNFAFELCATKIDDADLEGLDLSTLRLLANGAEPVSVNTLAPVHGAVRALWLPARGDGTGLRPCRMRGGAGHAASRPAANHRAREPRDVEPRRQGRARESRTTRTRSRSSAAGSRCLTTRFASLTIWAARLAIAARVGWSFADHPRRRAIFTTRPRPARCSTTAGSTAATGAYIANADVFITGRTKDIIIRAGQHIYPHELEEAIGDIAGIRKGGVAVFGMLDAGSGTERMIIVAETDEADPRPARACGRGARSCDRNRRSSGRGDRSGGAR